VETIKFPLVVIVIGGGNYKVPISSHTFGGGEGKVIFGS
jgi:hypothetical protein